MELPAIDFKINSTTRILQDGFVVSVSSSLYIFTINTIIYIVTQVIKFEKMSIVFAVKFIAIYLR